MLYFDVLAVISTVVSWSEVTALSSIYKLTPGSVVPSWTVAELSHILFDGFDVNRHLASVSGAWRSSGSSQQLPLVLFDMVELSRPVVRSPA